MNVTLKPLTGKTAEEFLKDWKSSQINIEAFNKCKDTINKLSRKEDI